MSDTVAQVASWRRLTKELVDLQDWYLESDWGPEKARQVRAQRVHAREIMRRAPWTIGMPFPRTPRAGAGIDAALASAVLDQCRWLAVAGHAADNDAGGRRGFMIACKLTGLRWGEVCKAINDVAHVSADVAAEYWAAHMSPPDERYVGAVYAAAVPGDYDTYKIGFSTNLPKRMKSLSRTEGKPVELRSCQPGTMMHEWAIHEMLRNPVKPEWYRRENLPPFLVLAWDRKAAA